MDLHTPEDVPDTPAQRAADRRRLILALNASLAFVLLLAAAFALQQGTDFRALTVAAREPAGLLGILTAPLLHGSFEHIAANAASLLLLGTLALAVYPKATLRALPLFWLSSGLGAWLLGDPGSHHLGASGLTHGLMFLVFMLGLLRRDRPSIAAAMIAFFLYGGMLLTVLPQEPGVSWQSHLGGAIGGVLGALLFRHADPLPPRKKYSWDLEDEGAFDEHDELELPPPDDVPVLWRRPPEERGVVLPFPRRDPPPTEPRRPTDS
ncbi:rhomboid family intramembrane serine protease [Lysobacter brunescens]|uniref:Rhomboid family intramembrane serine protease n=1 Tax=Lysobacter brunescens TaxID=262323 RepID=A0ABW2Y8Q4_9GAMM